MKKQLLAVIIASTFGLTACGEQDSSSTSTNPTNPTVFDPAILESLSAETTVLFDLVSDPSSPTIVIPSYLATDKDDQTLSVESTAVNPDDLSDPLVAMGKTDGWSTSQPIDVEFSGYPLDPSSAANSFYLLKSQDPSSPHASSDATLLVEGVDYTVKAKGETLTATLLKPLEPSSNYMFAVTNSLKDTQNNAVGTSFSYAVLKSTNKVPVEKLLPAQTITHNTENAFEQAGVDKSTIIFSSWFKTASVGDVLAGTMYATAQAIAHGPNTVWKGASIDNSVSAEQLASLYSMTTPVFEKNTPNDVGAIYYGKITLPYFLDINKENYLSSPWQSGMPSVAKIRHVLEEGTEADKQAVHAQLAALNVDVQDITDFEHSVESKRRIIDALSGSALTLANGSPVDSERLMTRFSVLPTLRSVQTIDYSMTIPTKPECQERGANAITIYQHGVTSDKGSFETSNLSDALLTEQCRAIFAINHPLHGDRGVGGKNAGSDPEMYLNLSSLTTARDNLRQSTIDVINFRAAIGLMAENVAASADPESEYGKLATISMDNGVGYAGHSLGAITGINAGSAVSNTLNSVETDNRYFALNKLALANPGAEIPYLLLNSTMFSPLIKGNVALKVNDKFAQQCGGKPWMQLLFCYGSYEKKLVNNGSPESLATLRELYDSYDHFAFAAQTVLDTVDPTNHARLISAELPVYMSQVNGDSIIPNAIAEGQTLAGTDILVPYSPFAGTKPLVQNLNIDVTTSSVSGTLVKNAALFKFRGGGHSSVLANDAKPGTTEMQQQMRSFVQGDGNTLTVTDATVMEE